MFWVNGKPAEVVALSDRSFQYGDGCFTTMLTRRGQVQNWSLHVERMQDCLVLLGIRLPDWEQINTWLEQAASDEELAGLKLHISRGAGGRGYNPVGAEEPLVTISDFLFPDQYHCWRNKGVELGVCQHKMGLNPLLAGHKHNNRLEQILCRAELESSGEQDGIMCDIRGNVIETTMANLFWLKGQTLYTPDLKLCGVSGVIRRIVLQEAPKRGLTVMVGDFLPEHIHNADEVFMTNSVLGVAPVVRIGLSVFSVGSVTRYFQENHNL